MCVAIYKKRGVKVPSIKTLKQCFKTNPDGAGIAVKRKCGIEITKGFMTFKEFVKGLEKAKITDDDEAFFHFRIATAGGITQGNCHPFPVKNSVRKLKKTHFFSHEVLVHNGVLPIVPHRNDISDTMELCLALAQTDDRFKSLKEIEDQVDGSRLALMGSGRDTILIGKWHDVDGVMFSNMNWDHSTYWKSWNNDFDYDDSNWCIETDCDTCEYADLCSGNYVNKKTGICEFYIPDDWSGLTPDEQRKYNCDDNGLMSIYGFDD